MSTLATPARRLPGGPAAALLGLGWDLSLGPAEDLDELLMLAVRDNPRRAQLAVSRVLAKHVPVHPAAALGAAGRLAGRVAAVLADQPSPVLVLGFCETATGLAHAVADALEADLLQTTRREVAGLPPVAGFDEEHSHAVGHSLLPRDPALLDGPRPLVLVDDELTTGTTALNTVAALHERWPRQRYVLAALVDLRTGQARRAFDERAAALGLQVDVVSLAAASLRAPADLVRRAEQARAALAAVPPRPAPPGQAAVRVLDRPWPKGVPTGGRHGLRATGRAAYTAAARGLGAAVLDQLPASGRVLVVGTEELIHLPVLVAAAVAAGRGGPGRRGTGDRPTVAAGGARDVLVQSTTRSPVAVADLPGYGVRSVVTAPAPDAPDRLTRLHNLVPPDHEPPPDEVPYAAVVVVTDTTAAAAMPLARALVPWAGEQVAVVPVPGAA